LCIGRLEDLDADDLELDDRLLLAMLMTEDRALDFFSKEVDRLTSETHSITAFSFLLRLF
jgi:hypothetical protein